jgi:hypothetical protein
MAILVFLVALLSRHRKSEAEEPQGQAAFEYVILVAGVVLIWLAIERSPQGFAAALLRLLDHYKFLISIPW